MARRTPQEKKQIDYKRQRRSRWDSDKAAREAIPRSKALRNRKIRKTAKLLLKKEDSAETSLESVKIVARHTRGGKYSRLVTLREDIERARQRGIRRNKNS
jgi:hypothetical protein